MRSPPKNTPTKQESPPVEGTTTPQLSSNKKKIQKGWTREVEQLMADWADKALGYRWMHERTERVFYSKDLSFMFPVIILSTVTGAANFALDSVIQDPDYKKYAQLGLGGLSILTGIISTIANRLGYGGRSEAHKSAAVLWGKFQRHVASELSLHPSVRSDCMYFLKTCRTELDRLIEQSPTIPDSVINDCRREFAKYPNVRKPEIVGDIATTHVFVEPESSLTMANAKDVVRGFEPRIQRVLEESILPPASREDTVNSRGATAHEDVRAMREKLSAANEKTGRVPPGVGTLFADLRAAAGTDTIQHVISSDGDLEIKPLQVAKV